jgi:hypothetical protein
MHSIVCGTGTPKDRASYILFEYIDPAEVGADISLAEVELRKPRNIFFKVCSLFVYYVQLKFFRLFFSVRAFKNHISRGGS